MPNSERTIEIPQANTPPNSSSEPPNQPREHTPSPETSKDESVSVTVYEFIDSRELARRLTVPPLLGFGTRFRARSEDPLPHVNLGKYVRFLWGSPALELWIRRRIVVGNNRPPGRTRRKEQI